MATIKRVGRFLKKWKIELPCDPAIPLLHIYAKKIMILIHKDICTMLNIALFTISMTKHLAVAKWMDKDAVYTHTYRVEYHSATKSEILQFVTTQVCL